jgi:hypothetical protein
MMNLALIEQMSDEAAEAAAAKNLTPYVLFDENDVRRMPGGDLWNRKRQFPFPLLGTYQPEGWSQTDESFFVDTSGFGQDYESALTWAQFNEQLLELVRSGRRVGLGIGDVGQFQLYVNVYERNA